MIDAHCFMVAAGTVASRTDPSGVMAIPKRIHDHRSILSEAHRGAISANVNDLTPGKQPAIGIRSSVIRFEKRAVDGGFGMIFFDDTAQILGFADLSQSLRPGIPSPDNKKDADIINVSIPLSIFSIAYVPRCS
jgi:hypothetical protein